MEGRGYWWRAACCAVACCAVFCLASGEGLRAAEPTPESVWQQYLAAKSRLAETTKNDASAGSDQNPEPKSEPESDAKPEPLKEEPPLIEARPIPAAKSNRRAELPPVVTPKMIQRPLAERAEEAKAKAGLAPVLSAG